MFNQLDIQRSRLLFRPAFFVILFFKLHLASAQKVVVESATVVTRIERSMSEEAAINSARQQAQVKAIENAFGTVVIQGNSTYVENKQVNNKVESSTRFNLLMNSYVNGEWVETIHEKHEIITQKDGSRWVEYSIKGKIKELVKNPVDFECITLSCPEKKCETEVFNDHQELNIFFSSAQDGFLSIYYDYNGTTYRMLPYSGSNLTNVPIKADQEYIFFNKEFDYFNEGRPVIDVYTMLTDTDDEDYKIFVLYAKNNFGKPILSGKAEKIVSEKNGQYFKLPKSLSSEEFQKWKNGIMHENPDLQLKIIPIVVRKK